MWRQVCDVSAYQQRSGECNLHLRSTASQQRCQDIFLPRGGHEIMRSLQEEVHECVQVLETRTTEIFSELAQACSLERTGETVNLRPWVHEKNLALTQAELFRLVDAAVQHQENQMRLTPLIERIKERDTKQRQTIMRVSELQTELLALLERGVRNAKDMKKAESTPIYYNDILEYAQRLARYTSAPRGHRLQEASQVNEATGDTSIAAAQSQKASQTNSKASEQHQQHHIEFGKSDYNQNATRAMSYYDPVIPETPQELPFPSDRLMRQGILYADAAKEDGVMTEPTDATAQSSTKEEHELVESQKPAVPSVPVLDSFAMDTDDAFDLDLNP